MPLFCNEVKFSGSAACWLFQAFLPFGCVWLTQDVCQMKTSLCDPMKHYMWNRTKYHRLCEEFLLDNSTTDLLQLFSRQCGRLSAYLKTFP